MVKPLYDLGKPESRLRVLYACTICGRIYEGDGYYLRSLFGHPAICTSCKEKKP